MTDEPEPTAAPPAAAPQKPLRLVGIGLVVLMLMPDFRGYDLLPDTVGWLLVLVGSAAFARGIPSRSGILWAAGLAAVAAAAIWPPHWEEVIRDQEMAVVWAILLPQVVWSILFCLAASGLSSSEPVASVWWKYLAIISVAVGVLPVIVYGGGVKGLESTLETLNFLGLVGTMILAFWNSSRPWAVIEPPAATPAE